MNSRKAFGPGVEEFREKYKSPLTYEHFRGSLNEYLRAHGAAELGDDTLIRHLFKLTIDYHRDLAAAEAMTIVFRSRDWKARSKVAKKMRAEVKGLTAGLKLNDALNNQPFLNRVVLKPQEICFGCESPSFATTLWANRNPFCLTEGLTPASATASCG